MLRHIWKIHIYIWKIPSASCKKHSGLLKTTDVEFLMAFGLRAQTQSLKMNVYVSIVAFASISVVVLEVNQNRVCLMHYA